MAFDLIIKNGTLLDGLSKQARQADVAISGDKIAAIGQFAPARGAGVFDASGKYVCPGFVDIQNHSDSYMTLLETPGADGLVAQGITTIAVGQCGSSLAPITGPDALKSIQKWHSLAGANINWVSFSEYLATLERYPLGVNVASLAGHSTIRRGLLGDQIRAATPEEVGIIEKVVSDSMDQGAAGLSLGLVYAHETNATSEELLAAAKAVAGTKKLYSVHLRSESSHVSESLNEAIDLAERAQARLKISHFKIRGSRNWPLADEALSVIDRAYQRGVDVFFDVYPYTTSWTVLYTYLPKWSYEAGRDSVLKNISEGGSRKKILAYLSSLEQDLGAIFIATSESNPALSGRTLAQIAANQEVSVQEALLNVISATASQAVVFDRNLSEDILLKLLRHPLSVVATDGAGYDFSRIPQHGLVHPRCFGAMPRFLQIVRDKKIMDWPEAVNKITSIPAAKLGLKNRGTLREGGFADVVVFDPRDIGSPSTYENPYREPDGIDLVLVNGRLARSATEPAGARAGRVLRV